MRYSYFHATPSELFAHVARSSRSSVSAAKRYYTQQGYPEIVARINAARLELRISRLLQARQAAA